MDINVKCEIIEEFIRDHVDTGLLKGIHIDEFIFLNNLGIPLSQAVSYNLATLTALGEEIVESTWISLCEIFSANPNDEYEDFEDIINSEEIN